ncbi:GAF and ANTAR domain-containing protein [Williamsia sp. 1135]|uniref:GAF and ANTAR domain-containing protein n=1 Tax=Williamsia sp. 1135 TaxID=1889262 RepID=UPI00143B521C|nr:GAF and ANTAR domain-containing protein [Williamsia sp. 1135]
MSGTSGRDAHPSSGGGDPHEVDDRNTPATDSARNPVFLGVGQLCETAVRLSGVDGAAVALLTRKSRVRDLVYATDAISQQIDELQFTLGEGPCLDAFYNRAPHLVPDLRDRSALERWPVFSGEAFAVGARAVFAFPVVEGGHPLGVLELYRRTEGELETSAHTAAITIANTAGLTVRRNWDEYLTSVDDAAHDPDTAAEGLLPSPLDAPDEFSRSQVYLASGMVAVQLAIPASEALDRLRAFSYQHGRSIKDVADQIVARRLTLRDTDELEGR